MKLLLDMYRSAPKEQRDKVQLMAAEKKYNSEVITLSHHIIHAMHRNWISLGSFFSVDDAAVIYMISILILGRGAAAEAEGTGGEGEEGGKENGRRRGSEEDPLCGGAD